MAIALMTLALMGTVALLGTVVLGYAESGASVALRRHFLAGLGSTTLLVMAHSFIMFFLLATGVELKNLERERGWGQSFRKRTLAIKAQVFPAMSAALLLVIANFILGAAAHTRVLPVWAHEGLAWLTVTACVATLWLEVQALGRTNALILEAGRRRAGQP